MKRTTALGDRRLRGHVKVEKPLPSRTFARRLAIASWLDANFHFAALGISSVRWRRNARHPFSRASIKCISTSTPDVLGHVETLHIDDGTAERPDGQREVDVDLS